MSKKCKFRRGNNNRMSASSSPLVFPFPVKGTKKRKTNSMGNDDLELPPEEEEEENHQHVVAAIPPQRGGENVSNRLYDHDIDDDDDDDDDTTTSQLHPRPPNFKPTARNQQRHRKPLYSVAWCTDQMKGTSGTEYQYLATCGHNLVSIYEVQVDTPRGVFQVKQTYRDGSKDEQFYTCEWAGRSVALAHTRLKGRADRRAESYAANAEDTSSSRSDYEDEDEEDDSENGCSGDEQQHQRGKTTLDLGGTVLGRGGPGGGTSSNNRSSSSATSTAAADDDDDGAATISTGRGARGGEEVSLATFTVTLFPEHCEDTNYMHQVDDSRAARGPQLLCVAGVQRIIKVIDPVQRKQIATLQGHGNEIYDLKASPTEEFLLLSASVDESIRLWNMDSFSCVAIFAGHHGHDECVMSLSWHVEGNRFASSGRDLSIRLWNLDDGKVRETIQASRRLNPSQRRKSFPTACQQFPYFATKKVHRNIVDCVHFMGEIILSKSSYNSIVMWMPVLPGAPTCNVGASPYTPPSEVIALRTFDLHDCHLWFVRFAVDPGGRLLAVGTINGEIDIWDIDSCEEEPSQKLKAITKSTVRTLAFSPNGKMLVSCCDNAQVSKWNES